MRKWIIAAAAVALVSGAAIAQQKTIAIGTGGTGGVYYPLGGGLANLISKSFPNVQATAQVTGGSVDNLKLIGSGQSELAFSMADAALDAQKGQDKFKGSAVELRTLMVLYPNIMHVVSIEGTGVNTMADLKGKRVSTGSGGSATEVMAFRVIEAAGLDRDKDMKRERLGVAESVNAEVGRPPTALSPFAAAAITGGDPYKTTLQAWKYTLPAFLVPFAFVLMPDGIGLLMKIPKGGDWTNILWITFVTGAGLAALAAAAQGWALRRALPVERALFILTGLLLVFPALLEGILERFTGLDIPYPAPFGLALGAGLLVWQWMRPGEVSLGRRTGPGA